MAETTNRFRGYYAGTKANFASSALKTTADNEGLIVFIADESNGGKNSCIYARGTYFADFASLIAALAFVKGVKVSGTNYTAAAGGGFVEFAASDPATVALNVTDGKVTVGLTAAFIKKVDDVVTQAGNIAKDYLTQADYTALQGLIDTAKSEAISTVVGKSTDAKTADTLYGAKAYSKVEIVEATGTGSVAKTYTIKQGGEVIGTINTIKDLVIQSGKVEDKNGVKTLVITLNNGNTIDIPVTDLVDVYTAGDHISIDANNKISVKKSEIIAGLATDANAQSYASTAESNAKTYADNNFAKKTEVYTKTEVNAMFAWVEI